MHQSTIMKKMFIALLLVCILLSACDKETNNPQTSISNICFKGRYLGKGCWPVIQILEPVFKDTRWQNRDSIYKNVAGVGVLPEKYKDGKPFYFKISSIDSNMIYLTYCSPTKYLVVINTYSDSACNVSADN